MNSIPRRYDAEQVKRFSDTTIAYYDQFARAFWNGTRDHDVRQNYAAFLDAIEGEPPYSIDRKSTRLNSSHTVIYTLSLHDALPILRSVRPGFLERHAGPRCPAKLRGIPRRDRG